MPEPIKIFFSYAPKDEELREELATHLAILKRQGKIEYLYEGDVLAGKVQAAETNALLNAAYIILLLISPSFIASDRSYLQMQQAMARHKRGEAVVIPILLRPTTGWKEEPFGTLQSLPRRGDSIASAPDRDAALANIAAEIARVVENFVPPPPADTITTPDSKGGDMSTDTYDVFLSHNKAQKEWTRDLARRLRDAGLRVWFDEWSLRGGENWIVGLRQGVQESRHICLTLSPEFLANEWPRFEIYIAILDDPSASDRKLIPLLHTPCKLPPELAFRQALNFQDTHTDPARFEFRLAQLLADLDPSRERPTDFEQFQQSPGSTPATTAAPVTAQPPPRPGPAVTPPPSIDYNPGAIRNLLIAAFNDEDFTIFCFDNFKEVYDKFSAGTGFNQKTQLLVEHCERYLLIEKLLQLVEAENPAQYRRFAPRLRQ